MTVKKEFYLPSSDGVSTLHGVLWKPETACRGVLQVFHGMSEHILRYGGLAEYLSGCGIAVVGHDHLGHGKTAADGKLGYFADRDGHLCVLRDMHRVELWTEKHFSGKPRFLMGHSMGSFFLRRYLMVYHRAEYEDGGGSDLPISGAVIMGTGNQPFPVLLAGYGAAAVTGFLRGKEYRSRLLYELALGNYNRLFRPNRTDNDWLSREAESVDKFCRDPYCNFRFTCGAYQDFFRILLELKVGAKEGKGLGDLPLLFVSGEKDPVGSLGKGVRQVYGTYIKAGNHDVILKLYEDNRHELLHDTDREQVYEDIRNWMEAHLLIRI